jgi:predicted pyridoxine 5'-phosphate oxidase superfamily flavin-nucleotide-binding protein
VINAISYPYTRLIDINDCVVKKYYAFYPNQTVCSLFAADTEEEPRYTCAPTLGVRRIANFTIPKLSDVQYGERIDLLIKVSNLQGMLIVNIHW